MVRESVDEGVKLVNDLVNTFSKMVGGSTSVAELREHSRRMSEKIYYIIGHLVVHPACSEHDIHLITVGAIVEFFCQPVMENVCCGESFAVFRERVLRRIRANADRRIESMRSERTTATVMAMIRSLREVETMIASAEVQHGATRH